MKISPHFDRIEFSCECGCGYNTVDVELITVLEDLRAHFGKSVIINSGARCLAHNMSIGGKPTSQHLIGRAADIVVKDVKAADVQAYLLFKYSDKYGIGQYQGFTHIDTRITKARW
jgi:uncharacterized protein YcbK (DUF882 family)